MNSYYKNIILILGCLPAFLLVSVNAAPIETKIKNSKFENPKDIDEKITNSKFENPVLFNEEEFRIENQDENDEKVTNSKFKNPTDEKKVNSKFENPLTHDEIVDEFDFDEPIGRDIKITNSKFEHPTEEKIENSKFENPLLYHEENEDEFKIERPFARNIKFTNSKFKNPNPEFQYDITDKRIKNSKFKNPSEIDEIITNSKLVSSILFDTAESVTNNKFENPTPNPNKNSKFENIKNETEKTNRTSPFVFMIPATNGNGTGKSVSNINGVFAFLSNGVLRPLFSIGESISDGISSYNSYNAKPLLPFPLNSKHVGLLNFFGTSITDYPFAYRNVNEDKKKLDKA